MMRRWRQVRQRVQMRRLVYGTASVALVLATGILTDWLSGGADIRYLPVLVGIWALLGVLGFILSLRSTDEITVHMETPVPLRTPEEAAKAARAGLIVFVSLFKPMGKVAGASHLTPEERREAADKGEYQALDVMHSNLATTIAAVVNHAPQLKHCWLVATTARTTGLAGSLPYALPVVQYLKQVEKVECEFHFGPHYAVSIDDVPSIAPKTYDLVRAIYAEADALGLPAEQVVADFTPCPRDMTLGVLLASLSRDRDVQFMETRYGPTGEAEGPLTPVIFKFEPQIEGNK